MTQSTRQSTRQVRVGDVLIGGGAPVTVQSMTKTDTRDARATIEQIAGLADAGCEIIRLAVPDLAAAEALGEVKRHSRLPIVADIHFDYRLALEALRQGVDKLRINPGNIGSAERVAAVAAAARERGVPIRIGVNAGSLETDLLSMPSRPEAMVTSALRQAAVLEDHGFTDIVISLKASDVPTTIAACRLMAERSDYPLHIGVTETGSEFNGLVRSALGIGTLLLDGIGDTLRVSLTADPVAEVRAGYEILRAAGRRQVGPELIGCPTCGRTRIDLRTLLGTVERALAGVRTPLKVAVMGCAVNGPGEAREADIGVAGGSGTGVIFRHGEILRRVDEADLADEFLAELRQLLRERGEEPRF